MRFITFMLLSSFTVYGQTFVFTKKRGYLYEKPTVDSKRLKRLKKKSKLSLLEVDYRLGTLKGQAGHWLLVQTKKNKQGYIWHSHVKNISEPNSTNFSIELDSPDGTRIGEIKRSGLTYLCDYEVRNQHCKLTKATYRGDRLYFTIRVFYQATQHSAITRKIKTYRCPLSKGESNQLSINARNFRANTVCHHD